MIYYLNYFILQCRVETKIFACIFVKIYLCFHEYFLTKIDENNGNVHKNFLNFFAKNAKSVIFSAYFIF
jgi:hypothetical protein